MSTLIIISGGLDPIHKGHIELIDKASKFGDVCVILNTDEWLTKKKGKPFMCLEERIHIVSALHKVQHVWTQLDEDETVCKTIEKIVDFFKDPTRQATGKPYGYDAFLFGNGGDRAKLNTPEVDICIKLGVGLVWGLGEKIQSSSDLIKNAKTDLLTITGE